MHGRKAADGALVESAERSRAVIDALEEGIVLHEADGTISGCNTSACRILGRTEEEILGRGPRHSGPAVYAAWKAIRPDGTPFEPESHPAAITLLTGQPCSQVVMGIERPDGERVWLSMSSRPLRRPGQDEPFAVALSFSDITRRKTAEEELRRRASQQAALAALGRHALEGTEVEVLMDEAVRHVAAVLGVELCKIVDSTPAGLRLRAGLGWASDEAGGLRPVRLTTGGPGGERLSGIAVPVAGRERPWGVLSAASRAGRDFHPEDLEFLQAVANVLAVALEQEELRQKISKSSYEWRITFDAMPHPVLLLELDGHVVRLNEAARELAGLSFSEVLRRTVSEVRDAEPWRTIAARLAGSGETGQVQDGEGRTWDLSLNPVASPDGQGGVVVVARDLSDLVRLQESVRRSETMSALGILVAGVAHEVRNPLFGISATLTAFTTRFKRRTEYRRYVEVLQGGVDRLSALMQDLLDYGKPLRLLPEPWQAAAMMREAVATCAPVAAEAGVEIETGIEDGLPGLAVDRKRMIQVFQNLLENAIQHTPRGGRVAFRAAGGETGGALFRIEDEGPGFEPEDLPHVFEPFFTRRRGGTGLGLSIVQRIVEQHQGEIVAANRPGGGAVVTVRLPPGEGAEPVSGTASGTPRTARSRRPAPRRERPRPG
jgi:PAS domain S-box-containing protein